MSNLSRYFHASWFFLDDMNRSDNQAFAAEDLVVAKPIAYAAGPIFLAWILLDFFYDPNNLTNYFLIRILTGLCSFLLAFHYFPKGGLSGAIAKFFVFSAYSVANTIITVMLPLEAQGICLAGGVIVHYSIATILRWRPRVFVLWSGAMLAIHSLIYLKSPFDTRHIAMTFLIEISVFILSIIFTFLRFQLFNKSFQQHLEVENKKIKMEGILNNINEGIISIDSSLMIEPEYSSYSSMLFETKNSLAGEPFVDFIFRNSNLAKEQVSVIEETLKASIGESILNWEVNNHLLPFEIRIDLKKNGTIHSKILSMTWTPLLTRDIVERVLVTIRDETERRFLEQSLRISTEKNSRLAIIICELAQSNRERAARLVSETRETLLPLAAEHRDFLKTDMVHNLRRNFHTIKGVARSLSMNLLSNAVHSLESAIDMALHGKHEDLEKNLDEIHAITASYQDVFDTIFIPSVTSVSFGEGLWRIVTGVREHLKHHGFQDLIFNFVECSDHEIDIKNMRILESILVHALYNSADHGFILPLKQNRFSNGLIEPSIHITLENSRKKNELSLKIIDNGQGIDWRKIKEECIKRAFSPKKGENEASVLFLDGVSTTLEISHSSGRGLGLSAIAAEIRKLGGMALLHDNHDRSRGSTLSLSWPHKMFQEKQSNERLSKTAD